MKTYAYAMLLTETYPPFSNDHPTLEPVGAPDTLTAPGFTPPTSGPGR
jgi:hypothetical protein